MDKIILIALAEIKFILRNKAAIITAALFILMNIFSAYVSWNSHLNAKNEIQSYQAIANEEFANQPNRHPHRMVHYGHFAFREQNPLTAFDRGVDQFTGNMIYLEGHRQNGANFSEALQNINLLRVGDFTPAFMLQLFLPLLLIFISYSCVSREREGRSLSIILSQNIKPIQIYWGKLLALTIISFVLALPSIIFIFLIALSQIATAFILAISILLYCIFWCGLIVLISLNSKTNNIALSLLLGFWVVGVIMIPRLGSELSGAIVPSFSRVQMDLEIHAELLKMGDSHNPDDPYFNNFKKNVLEKYGVDKVEDLPINYKGLLALEGERMTSELFNKYNQKMFKAHENQNNIYSALGIINPFISFQKLSNSLSGTDYKSYQSFIEQAEKYRYEMVQHLNELQANELTYKNDTNKLIENRISSKNWKQYPKFKYIAQDFRDKFSRSLFAILQLGFWSIAIILIGALQSRKLRRADA